MSAAAVAVPRSLPPSGDFPDWLSPMFVKELRQGVRGRWFTIGFLLMHAVLMIYAVVMMGEVPTEGAGLLFWVPVGAVLMVLLPLRCISALRDEVEGSTLDLLMLTRVGALRLSAGKWSAVMAQAVLIALTVAPYLVLRYFAGGVNVMEELLVLVGMFLVASVATAFAVGFSWIPWFILRLILCGGMLWMTAGSGFGLAVMATQSRGMLINGASTDPEAFWTGLAMVILTTSWLTYLFLEIGASAVASGAENRTTPRRLVSLAFFLLLAGLLVWGPAVTGLRVSLLALSSLVAIAIAADALTDRPNLLPVVIAPFERKVWRRFAGVFLAPGWHSGVWYTLVITLIMVAVSILTVYRVSGGYSDDLVPVAVTVCFAAWGALLVPVAWHRLLLRKLPWGWGPFAGIQAMVGAFHFVLGLLAAVSRSTAVFAIGCFLPTLAPFVFADSHSRNDEGAMAVITVVVTGTYFLILVVRGSDLFREGRRLYAQAVAEGDLAGSASGRAAAADADLPVAE